MKSKPMKTHRGAALSLACFATLLAVPSYGGQEPAVTGETTSMMPQSEASMSAMKAASSSAPIPAAAISAEAMNGPSPGPRGPGPGCNLFPAPASVGATVGLSYFGPPPSASNPSLVGPYQFLQSGVVDDIKGTITLPLYKGYVKEGQVRTPVW